MELSLFVEELGGADRAPDTLDMLVQFAPDSYISLFDFDEIEDELAALFGRPVHILERAGLEQSSYATARRVLDARRDVVYARS